MLHQKGPITSTFTADWFLRGGGTGATGRLDEVNFGQVTRPKKNVAGQFTLVPVQRMDPQDYEGKGIGQMRPM